MTARTERATARALALALLAPLAVAACSGGSGAGDDGAEPAREGTTTMAETSGSGTPESGTTPAGTVLDLGEPGSVAWQAGAGSTGTVDLVVEQVRRRPASVLAGWVPGDEMARTAPYFVTAAVTNVGGTRLGGAALPLYLRDREGVLSPPVTFGGGYARCPSTPLPRRFGPCDEARLCLVYTLAQGAEADAVTFEASSDEVGVAWRVR